VVKQSLRPGKFQPAVSWATLFLFHAFIGIIFSSMVLFFVAAIADAIIKKYPLLKPIVDFGGPFDPIFWAPGFVIGFLLIRPLKQPAACWVWILGIIWLAVGVHESLYWYHLYYPRYYGTCSAWDNIKNEFVLMDSSRCGGSSEILKGFVFTTPALSSVGYSLGAWAALVCPKKETDPKIHS
jgi:hypothetical protein